MSVISIPYALANANMTQFKEITLTDYQTIVRALNSICSIHKERHYSLSHPASSTATTREQLKKEYAPLTKQYTTALEKLNAFKKRNFNVLSKGELIQDDEYPMPFSSIFTGETREQLFQKHQNKHRAIYEQLRSLTADVLRLQQYAPENVQHTIDIQIHNQQARIESAERNSQEKWEKDKRERLDKQHKILTPFKSGYVYVIQNLKININVPVYEISCTRRTMNNILKDDTQNFAHILINPSLQIQR